MLQCTCDLHQERRIFSYSAGDFKTGLLDATNPCACNEHSFNARCLEIHFIGKDFEVQKLKKLLQEEAIMLKEKRPFSLYRAPILSKFYDTRRVLINQ